MARYSTEAFLPKEQRMFLRFVEVMPSRRSLARDLLALLALVLGGWFVLAVAAVMP